MKPRFRSNFVFFFFFFFFFFLTCSLFPRVTFIDFVVSFSKERSKADEPGALLNNDNVAHFNF